MKLYILLILVHSMTIINCQDIQEKNVEKNSLNNDYFSEPLNDDGFSAYDFEQTEEINIDLNNDRIEDTIVLQRLKNWPDPGDFHLIEINITNEGTKLFFNLSGWMEKDKFLYNDNFEKLDIVNSKYIYLIDCGPVGKLLIVKGYAYASVPGLVAIIGVDKNSQISPLYNKENLLYDINVNENNIFASIIMVKHPELTKQEFEEQNNYELFVLNETLELKSGIK